MFEQFGREYIAVLTDKAIEFGHGDPNRIAAAALARLLSEFDIGFEWLDDLTFRIDTRFAIQARASTSTDHNLVAVGETTSPYTAAVRIERQIVAMQGLQYQAQWERLAAIHGIDAIPAQQLQSIPEWLGCFPQTWPEFLPNGERNECRDDHLRHRLHPGQDVQGSLGAVHA